jgi:uncharacterized membrane protein YhaH (DUF805 family)
MMALVGLDGRIGRGTWWLGFFAAFGIGITNIALFGSDITSLGALLLTGLTWVISISTTVKRYHDRGKSGWWFWLILLPIIGGIWQLIELGFCSGDEHENDYGPPPGSGRSVERLGPVATGVAEAASGRLAKLDDDYFRNYAAQQRQHQRVGEPLVQSTYARPSATVSAAPGFGARPTFGRR